MSQLGEAFVPIRATLDKLDGDLAGARAKIGAVVNKLGSIGAAVGKVALAGLVAAGLAVGGVLAKAIPLASNLNETLNKTNVIFGDASQAVIDFSQDAATALGQSQQQALDAASTFGVFGKSAGLTGEELSGFSINMTTLASDLASFNNSTPEEAILAIGAALRGESEPIRRFGVLLDDATLRSKALELGLISTTKDALTPQQKVLAAYNVILDQTADAQGDFARTSTGLANAQRIAQAGVQDLLASIGQGLLPVVETFLNDVVIPLLPRLQEWAAVFSENIAPAAQELGNVLMGLFSGNLEDPIGGLANIVFYLAQAFGLGQEKAAEIFDSIIALREPFEQIWATLSGFVTETVIPFIQDHAPGIQAAFIAIGAVLAAAGIASALIAIVNPVTLIIVAVGLLAAAWTEDWGGIRTTLTAWWDETGEPIFNQLQTWLAVNVPAAIETLKSFWVNTLQPAMQAVWTWISGTLFPLFVELADWLGPVLTAAIQGLSDFWTGTLKPALEAVWGFVQDDLIPLFEALRELFDVALTLALTALAGLWQNVLQPALEAVWSFIRDNLFPIFEEIGGWLGETFGPIIDNLISGKLGPLQNAFVAVRDAIKWVIDKVDALIKKLQDFKLPPILTPGSPTPFELGLRGIADAFDDLTTRKIPAFNDAFGKGIFGETPGNKPVDAAGLDLGSLMAGYAPPVSAGLGMPVGAGGPMTTGEIGLGSPVGAGGPMTTGGVTEVHVYIDGREMKEGVITEIVERGRLGLLSRRKK